jgi:SNF2 family DNA or RNA helicase
MSQPVYGDLKLNNGHWLLAAEPHVLMMAKRIFGKLSRDAKGLVTLPADAATSRDLEWFVERYPLRVHNRGALAELAGKHRDTILRLNQIIDPNYKPSKYELRIPARDYQRLAADWMLRTHEGLLGDQVGLGKTCSAICAMSSGKPLPCLVVCPTHIQTQWRREIEKFAPDLRAHIITKGTPYQLPKIKGQGPDVLIINYHKLDGWAEVLAAYCKGVVFDECQELRRAGDRTEKSKKYAAAEMIAAGCEYRIGMSGTPVYNYGGEIWNVLQVLAPNRLGSWGEFRQEWCTHDADDASRTPLRDPEEFGSWLRAEFLMLRRTRRDVGRELEKLTKITHQIDADGEAFAREHGRAAELARIICAGTGLGRGEARNARGEFTELVRQATGIAKAPYVAAFVEMLIESGEKVVLFGWHHACYAIYAHHLKKYSPAFYTGQQTEKQKDEARDRFIEGATPLIVLSLRAGAGLDGLQSVANTVVFGELDWSPGAHEQAIGRVMRDGQTEPVTAYFLVSDQGLDPAMVTTLGLKSAQVEGIRSDGVRPLEQRVDSDAAIRALAERYVGKARSA